LGPGLGEIGVLKPSKRGRGLKRGKILIGGQFFWGRGAPKRGPGGGPKKRGGLEKYFPKKRGAPPF